MKFPIGAAESWQNERDLVMAFYNELSVSIQDGLINQDRVC